MPQLSPGLIEPTIPPRQDGLASAPMFRLGGAGLAWGTPWML